MKRFIAFGLAFMCVATQIVAQEKLMTVGVTLSTKAVVVPVKDKATGNYTLLAHDKNKLYVWRSGDNFTLTNNYEIPLNNDNRNGELIGGWQNGSEVQGYLLKPGNGVVSFAMNADSGDYNIKELDFISGTDNVLRTFTFGTTFWILAINSNNPNLIVYTSTDGGNFSKHIINIGGLSANRKNFSLYNFLADRYKDLTEVPEINDHAENPVWVTWHPFKMYKGEDKLVLTLDGEGATRMVMINTDLNIHEETISYPKTDGGAGKITKGNSVISKGIFAQFVAGPQDLSLRLFDFPNLDLIKEFPAKNGRDITFRNGPLLDFDKVKGDGKEQPFLIKTSDMFYNRLMELPIAISIADGYDKTLIVTMAAVKATLKGPGIRATNPSNEDVNPEGGVERVYQGKASFVPYHYVQAEINSFKNRALKQTSILKSILDINSFEHVKGDAPPSIFEKIKTFEKGLFGLRAQIMINTGWSYVLGYCNPATAAYVLVSFTEEN